MLSKAKTVSCSASKSLCIAYSTVSPSEIHSEKSGKEIKNILPFLWIKGKF
jgi:hypothetical protein